MTVICTLECFWSYCAGKVRLQLLPSWQGRNAKIVVYLSVKCPIDLHSLPGSTEGFCCVMMALFSITRRLLRTACTANTVQSTTLHCSDYNQLVVVRPIGWRTSQPWTFQPQASTSDLPTPVFSNHKFFNSGLLNHEFLNHGVEKFMVEKSGVEMSSL